MALSCPSSTYLHVLVCVVCGRLYGHKECKTRKRNELSGTICSRKIRLNRENVVLMGFIRKLHPISLCAYNTHARVCVCARSHVLAYCQRVVFMFLRAYAVSRAVSCKCKIFFAKKTYVAARHDTQRSEPRQVMEHNCCDIINVYVL